MAHSKLQSVSVQQAALYRKRIEDLPSEELEFFHAFVGSRTPCVDKPPGLSAGSELFQGVIYPEGVGMENRQGYYLSDSDKHAIANTINSWNGIPMLYEHRRDVEKVGWVTACHVTPRGGMVVQFMLCGDGSTISPAFIVTEGHVMQLSLKTLKYQGQFVPVEVSICVQGERQGCHIVARMESRAASGKGGKDGQGTYGVELRMESDYFYGGTCTISACSASKLGQSTPRKSFQTGANALWWVCMNTRAPKYPGCALHTHPSLAPLSLATTHLLFPHTAQRRKTPNQTKPN